MPRISRSLIGSAFIHNMVQGINKEYIFENEKYKEKYLNLIEKYSKKYGILMVAYCIMDNHAHLLTYSENIERISQFMKDINSEYAMYYNKIRNRVGYVFRNRFSSKVIYNQEYLFKCIKYIHMNPVKAEITQKEEEYKFSSYRNFLNQNKIIKSKLFEVVFNQEKECLEKFETTEYEALNLEYEKCKIGEVLKEFLEKKKVKVEQVRKEKILIEQFMTYLISREYVFTKKEIAEVLKISRAGLYRKLNKGDTRK